MVTLLGRFTWQDEGEVALVKLIATPLTFKGESSAVTLLCVFPVSKVSFSPRQSCWFLMHFMSQRPQLERQMGHRRRTPQSQRRWTCGR